MNKGARQEDGVRESEGLLLGAASPEVLPSCPGGYPEQALYRYPIGIWQDFCLFLLKSFVFCF